jgi:hypothetical protein
MNLKEEVLTELNSLIEEAEELDESYRMSDMGTYESDLPEYRFRSFTTAAFAAIQRIAGKDSEYYQEPARPEEDQRISVAGWGKSIIPSLRGSLVALKRAVKSGHLESLESRLRANIHDDFLQQAEDLLSSDYYVAGMVLIGSVLEDHLRKMCRRENLSWDGHGSLGTYNEKLRGESYEKPTWRRIQSITDLRNKAAHGEGDEISPDDVQDALQYTIRFVEKYPA